MGRIRTERLAGVSKFTRKCLVELDTENRITMHDHLRDMGRDLHVVFVVG